MNCEKELGLMGDHSNTQRTHFGSVHSALDYLKHSVSSSIYEL